MKRTYRFIPSDPKKSGTKPWEVVVDDDGIRCDCPGFRWHGYCRHINEVKAARQSVRVLTAMEKAQLIELIQEHSSTVLAAAREKFPSATTKELKTYLTILNDAFMENEESLCD